MTRRNCGYLDRMRSQGCNVRVPVEYAAGRRVRLHERTAVQFETPRADHQIDTSFARRRIIQGLRPGIRSGIRGRVSGRNIPRATNRGGVAGGGRTRLVVIVVGAVAGLVFVFSGSGLPGTTPTTAPEAAAQPSTTAQLSTAVTVGLVAEPDSSHHDGCGYHCCGGCVFPAG